MGGAQANPPVREKSKRVNFRDQQLVLHVYAASDRDFSSLRLSSMSEAETDCSATPDRLYLFHSERPDAVILIQYWTARTALALCSKMAHTSHSEVTFTLV